MFQQNATETIINALHVICQHMNYDPTIFITPLKNMFKWTSKIHSPHMYQALASTTNLLSMSWTFPFDKKTKRHNVFRFQFQSQKCHISI